MSSWRPHVRTRAGSPGAAGVVTLTARAAWSMAVVSRAMVTQAGGASAGPAGAVEADDGVEVDDAATLVFGDLGVGDPELHGEGLAGEPGLTG